MPSLKKYEITRRIVHEKLYEKLSFHIEELIIFREYLKKSTIMRDFVPSNRSTMKIFSEMISHIGSLKRADYDEIDFACQYKINGLPLDRCVEAWENDAARLSILNRTIKTPEDLLKILDPPKGHTRLKI